LRVERPSGIPRDLPLAVDDRTVPLRVSVAGVVGDDQMGRFDLKAGPDAPLSAFVSREWLAARTGVEGKASLLLVAENPGGSLSPAEANGALRAHFSLEDAELNVQQSELRSDRIFLDPPVVAAAEKLGGRGVLAWFVNEVRNGDRSSPYAAVVAIGDEKQQHGSGPFTEGPPPMKVFFNGVDRLRDGEVLVNDWLAVDLGLRAGDEVELHYDRFGLAHRMEKGSARLVVAGVIPAVGPDTENPDNGGLKGAGAVVDSRWMPDIPGLTDVADCREWAPGFSVDVTRLRPKDQEYWRQHRATPKVFLTLAAGERLFGSRYGNRTSFSFDETRLPDPHALLASVAPSKLGLSFAPVRRTTAAAVDFGPLFAGFSFVLVVSALLLTALLFSFSLEQRSAEIGTLAALGFRAAEVRTLVVAEAAGLAIAAGLIGVPAGLLFTRAVLAGLSSVWRDAVGLPSLHLHVSATNLLLGGVAGAVASLVGLAPVLRRQLRSSAHVLLADPNGVPADSTRAGRWPLPLAGVFLLGALTMVWSAGTGHSTTAAETFFTAGALLLGAGLLGVSAFLSTLARAESLSPTRLVREGLFGLALRGVARRRGRGLATVSLLASGTFLVGGVAGNRQDPRSGDSERGSGTGGFALVADTARPIARDLNTADGRKALGVDATLPFSAVSLRVHDGDEASCRSPGRTSTPRLYGVDPEALASRGAFTFTASLASPGDAAATWQLLNERDKDGTVPAIGDEGTVIWSLHLGLGDTLATTAEDGQLVTLRIVGITTTSALQGGLVISEEAFVRSFPGEGGYRMFLLDATATDGPRVQEGLMASLRDRGLRVQPAWRRLASFQSVENTYLAIFQALGALGLLLGCAGVGVLVMRNVLERRGELAVLAAIGFPLSRVRRLVVLEHALLVVLGLLVGGVAAFVCRVPVLRAPGSSALLVSLARDLGLVGATGLLSAVAAATLALRGSLATVLRAEE
jgi:ABC-type lipoprotein release transport system permease subunit